MLCGDGLPNTKCSSITIALDKSLIPVVEETKSFVPHLNYVKKKGLKALNIGNTEFGADRKVRSKLDYGCIVYGSARKSYLHAGSCTQPWS